MYSALLTISRRYRADICFTTKHWQGSGQPVLLMAEQSHWMAIVMQKYLLNNRTLQSYTQWIVKARQVIHS